MTDITDLQSNRHTVRSFDEDLSLLTAKVMEMGAVAEKQVAQSIESLVKRDGDLALEVMESDSVMDGFEEEIDQMVVALLAKRQPMASDLRMITMALKISNDLERTGDYAVSIAKRAQRLAEQPETRHIVTIPQMGKICLGMLKDVLDAYVEHDVAKSNAVWERDKEVDTLYTGLFRELITYMLEDPRTISRSIDLLFIAKNLERIGDHATNIAEKISYIAEGRQINRPRHDAV
ncbi:MAG: phosphate signaling complex protein PhoU [Geminicoccaceae bacterium]